MSTNFKYRSNGIDLKITIDDDNQAECPQCKCKYDQQEEESVRSLMY